VKAIPTKTRLRVNAPARIIAGNPSPDVVTSQSAFLQSQGGEWPEPAYGCRYAKGRAGAGNERRPFACDMKRCFPWPL